MSVKPLTLSLRSKPRENIYEGTETLTNGKGGSAFIFPDQSGKIDKITIRVYSESGSCYLRTSNTPQISVRRGIFKWQDLHELGTITHQNASIVISPVSAIKLVRISGKVTIEIEAQ